ncbi:MAG: STAS domain-containing protein [Comamonadaceae bacterium]
MATKGTTAGLFSKMGKFILHPTKDWSELDKIDVEPAPETEPDRGYSKQALKEMIQRKRQNDFVRRREFDELRKLRRAGPVANGESAGRPSFFQGTTTTSNLEERANTIKKIDEIEAQMSKQWWKGKQNEAAVEGGNFHLSASLHLPQGAEFLSGNAAKEKPAHTLTQSTGATKPDSEQGQTKDFDPTQPGLPDDVGNDEALTQPQMMGASDFEARRPSSGGSGFSPSNLFAIELGDTPADTEMEEAAIRFANGDVAGAEAGLLAALRTDNVRPDVVKGWAAALFDLYRATGQQGSFEHVAMEYAQRFGHAAPVWFSTLDELGRISEQTLLDDAAESSGALAALWDCPRQLDMRALQDLRTRLLRAAQPWRLNWRHLRAITPDAAAVLADMMAKWCTQPVALHFDGADALEKTLRSSTPSGDSALADFWWHLRLDALRIMHLQDEFELAALDFCVTYEVSPPPWQNVLCQYAAETMTRGDGSRSNDQEDLVTVPGAEFQPTRESTEPMAIDDVSGQVFELSGQVLGDAAQALNKLQTDFKGASRLIVSCDKLIRVDFSAAGSILNWVAAREAEGCHVQFRDVPRLVAAFFEVIGINDHARVILRNR